MKLRIYREDKDKMIVYCPFHKDGQEEDASMILNKTGEFAGKYHCFGCGADGKIKDLGLNIQMEKSMRKQRKKIDWYDVWEKYWLLGHHEAVNKQNSLTLEWGVSFSLLRNYGYGWTGSEHCYPMCDIDTSIIGIQRRYENGRKVNIKDSRLGLFLPNDLDSRIIINRLIICEGWSDTVVCADLIEDSTTLVIGRPNAKAVRDMCVRFCKKWVNKDCRISNIVDNDGVGFDGGQDILRELWLNRFGNFGIWQPPQHKDFRQMVQEKGKEYAKKWLGV